MWLCRFIFLVFCINTCHGDETIISSDQGMKVYEADNYFVANGNVQVQRGGIGLRAATGKGVMHETKGGARAVKTLSLQGNFQMDSKDIHIVADEGVYDLDHDFLTLKGKDIFLKGKDIRAQTQGNVLYLPKQSKLKISNRTKLWQEDKLFVGDAVDIIFASKKREGAEVPAGLKDVCHIYVHGNLKFIFKEAIIFASHALYDVSSDKIYAFGCVRLSTDQRQLEAFFVSMDRTNGTIELDNKLPRWLLDKYPEFLDAEENDVTVPIRVLL